MAYKDMTKKALKDIIRAKTADLNKAIAENDVDSFAMKQAINKLQSLGAKGRKGNVVGLGLSRNRSKESLIRQIRELDYVTPLVTNEGVSFLDEKYKSSYRTFLKDHPNVTEEEWRELVTTFGSVGEDIVSKFDSNQIADIVKDSGKRVDISQIMIDIIRDGKTKGSTVRSNTDEFMRRLNEL